MPRLFILSGCNGAGKTTASYTFLPEILDCREFVNSDEFAKSLSPFDPSIASVSASRYMLMRIQYLLDQNADFSIETTLATRSLVSIIKEAKERNYKITLIYLWLQNPELAIQRVRDSVQHIYVALRQLDNSRQHPSALHRDCRREQRAHPHQRRRKIQENQNAPRG